MDIEKLLTTALNMTTEITEKASRTADDRGQCVEVCVCEVDQD